MLSPEVIPLMIALLGAAALAAVIFVVIYPYVSGEKQTEKRVASVTESRSVRGPASSARTAADVAAQRKKQVQDSLKDLEIRQKAKEKVTLRLRLQRAGLDAEPRTYWIASMISGLVCTGIVLISSPPTELAYIGAAIAAFVGTFGLPRFVLSRMIKRRQTKFTNELANAIDVIVRGVKSGLPLNECLQIIARESPEPIASEFRDVVEQQRVGVTLGEALERLANRIPLAEVRFLTIVISIQQQAGGNLSEALNNLSGVLRDRLKMSIKVKALSAEAKTSAMVLGSLPPGVMSMVYMSTPDYIMPLFVTQMGHFMLAASAIWMSMGILMMHKMVNFKY